MSRTDARSDSLRHRPSRVVPATILGLIVLVLGVGLVWVAVLALINGSWPAFPGGFHRWLTGLSWGSAIVIAIAVAVAVIGLILLIAALIPGQPNAVRLNRPESTSEVEDTEFVMTRRSVARLAAARAKTLDGVDSVSATASANKVTMSVRTASAESGEVAAQVDGRVREALQAAGLANVPTVSSNVRTQTR